ncbi:MAG: hypothetical protein CVU38_03905 [Chloroflexi bacterium HGW-Chloroflexi-1]|nr:MAG: hypothetical protein CVU38_03905 [Chloroflexi bacterium HGW-Chloroflexi-1]
MGTCSICRFTSFPIYQSTNFPTYRSHHQLDHHQDQRQPGGRGDDHGEVDADDEKAGEGVGDRGQDRGRPALSQNPGEDVHPQRGQP